MTSGQYTEFENRILPQVMTLVTQATGETDEEFNTPLVKALMSACVILERDSRTPCPIVSLEKDVVLGLQRYHLNVRRLKTSVPPGKFQILISRELASGLIH